LTFSKHQPHTSHMSTVMLQLGSKVYIANAVAGEPGVIRDLREGRATVEWAEPAHFSRHAVEELVPDESFLSGWLGLDERAA